MQHVDFNWNIISNYTTISKFRFQRDIWYFFRGNVLFYKNVLILVQVMQIFQKTRIKKVFQL